MPKILIVEDEVALIDVMTDYLKAQSFLVDHVGDGNDAIRQLKNYEYDLIILDWNIPGCDGIHVLKAFRDNGGLAPVLMLTGKREIDDKEKGFDAGADDYLTKPFNMRELLVRVKALLRRPRTTTTELLKVRDVELDPVNHRVRKAGVEVVLPPKEFALLEFLISHPNQVFSAEALMQRVWPTDSEASPQSIRIHVTRLRGKLDKDDQASIITTVHGVGYRLDS